MPAPSRLEFVVDLLDLRPTDRVVEIGCGHGAAATLVLARITAGSYTGVDRSATMVAASEQRNREAVAAGQARFVRASFTAAELDAAAFDRAFAVRVAAMVGRAELTAAARCLRPGGLLILAFDAPSEGRTAALVAEAAANLDAAGLAPVASDTGSVLVAVRR